MASSPGSCDRGSQISCSLREHRVRNCGSFAVGLARLGKRAEKSRVEPPEIFVLLWDGGGLA